MQLLPVFNLFRGKNSNMGDAIDYNQRSRINIGELIMETLEVGGGIRVSTVHTQLFVLRTMNPDNCKHGNACYDKTPTFHA